MHLKYRPEIDGLRAIAVIAVVIYHAGFAVNGSNALAGGYIGVDVFFVISGYLITSIILKELATGQFSFSGFYERRARRILPILFTVMLASIPFAWLYMLPKAMKEYAGSILSALAFGSNIWFWQEDSYWAEPSALKPFLHTWSLSVEEQFYVLFPIGLLFLWKYGRNHIHGLFLVMFVLSLALAQYGSLHFSVASFYLLPTRGWELLAGAILANLEINRGRNSHALLSATMPLLGALMVCSAFFLFDDNTRHPSLITLLPIAGTMLLIWYCKKGEAVTNLLSSKPFVGIGLLSYGIYLWHYPIFAFAKIRDPNPTTLDKFAWIALSLALSSAAYFLIEKPARNKQKLAISAFTSAIFATLAVLVIFQAWFYKTDGVVDRLAFNPALLKTFSRPDFEKLCSVKDQMQIHAKGLCMIGTASENPDYLLIGDSHAAHAINLFHELGLEQNKSLGFTTFVGCPPVLGVYSSKFKAWADICKKLNDDAFNYAVANNISKVFMLARWDVYVSDIDDAWLLNTHYGDFSIETSRETLERQLETTFRKYTENNIEVILMLQAPHQKANPKEFYQAILNGESQDPEIVSPKLKHMIEEKSVTTQEHIEHQKIATEIIKRAAGNLGIIIIDPTEVLCDEKCYIGTPLVSYYFDDDHLSLSGFDMLKPAFRKHFN